MTGASNVVSTNSHIINSSFGLSDLSFIGLSFTLVIIALLFSRLIKRYIDRLS